MSSDQNYFKMEEQKCSKSTKIQLNKNKSSSESGKIILNDEEKILDAIQTPINQDNEKDQEKDDENVEITKTCEDEESFPDKKAKQKKSAEKAEMIPPPADDQFNVEEDKKMGKKKKISKGISDDDEPNVDAKIFDETNTEIRKKRKKPEVTGGSGPTPLILPADDKKLAHPVVTKKRVEKKVSAKPPSRLKQSKEKDEKKRIKSKDGLNSIESKTSQFPDKKIVKKDLKTEGFFKSIVSKAKTKMGLKLNKSDDTYYVNPETQIKTNDVKPDYGGPEDFGPSPEKCYANNDNKGNIFPNGRPFWCQKDEKLPLSSNYVVSTAMRDFLIQKFTLTPRVKEPSDLDPYSELGELQFRDETFKKEMIISNTIRSSAMIFNLRQKHLKGNIDEFSTKEGTNTPKLTFFPAKILTQYNRKNRKSGFKKIPFTPGIAQKKRLRIVMSSDLQRKSKSQEQNP